MSSHCDDASDVVDEFLADVYATVELVEVFAINTMAPFILNKRAIPLLEKVHETWLMRCIARVDMLCRFPVLHRARTHTALLSTLALWKASSTGTRRRITRTQTWPRRQQT